MAMIMRQHQPGSNWYFKDLLIRGEAWIFRGAKLAKVAAGGTGSEALILTGQADHSPKGAS
jgi:hypothetical protein